MNTYRRRDRGGRLRAAGGASPESILRSAAAALDAHLAGAPASDDVTMICLKIR